MKPATLPQLQKELSHMSQQELLSICIKLAKYKKENKELLNFLIYGAHDRKEYFSGVKESLEESFSQINRSSAYTTKKGLQKMVRLITKHVRQSASLQTELELRLWFCMRIRQARINLDASQVTSNLFYREIERIKVVAAKLHEDVRADYASELSKLNISIDY
jgi:hypothetical protein